MSEITFEDILRLPEENRKNIAYIMVELLQFCMPPESAPLAEIVDACIAGFEHWRHIPDSDFCVMVEIISEQMGKEMVETILDLPKKTLEDLIESTITTNWKVFEKMYEKK